MAMVTKGAYTHKDVDEECEALQAIREAYGLLNDPNREEELDGAIRFFRHIRTVDGQAVACAWLRRQALLIQREAMR